MYDVSIIREKKIIKIKEKTLELLSYIFLVLWILIIADGLYAELQMLIWNNVSFSALPLKMGLVFIALLSFGINYKINLPKVIIICWATFILYLLLEMVFLINIHHFSVLEIYANYNLYYIFLIILPFVFSLKNTIKPKKIFIFLLCFFFVFCFIAILQHNSNDVIIRSVKSGNFKPASDNFYGDIRAFSLFGSASAFGHYLAFMVSLFVTLLIKNNNKVISFLLLLLTIYVTYITYTRSSYLEVLLAILTTIVINLGLVNKKIYKSIPVFYGIIGIFIVYFASGIGSSNSLVSGESALIRTQLWLDSLKIWFENGTSFLLGTGLTQNENFLIDNTFLATGVNIGFIGLLFWLIYMISLYRYSLSLLTENPINIAVIVTMSLWIFTGMSQISFLYNIAFFFIIILIEEPVNT